MARRISSLLKKPDSGKIPESTGAHPESEVSAGQTCARPRNRLMSITSPIACITLPAARNKRALKNAWVNR